MLSQKHLQDMQSIGDEFPTALQALRERIKDRPATWWIPGAMIALLIAAYHSSTLHWLAGMVATVGIIGGMIAPPLLSAAAWIGLSLPPHVWLHQIADLLVVCAVLWFLGAVASAQLLHGRQQALAANARSR